MYISMVVVSADLDNNPGWRSLSEIFCDDSVLGDFFGVHVSGYEPSHLVEMKNNSYLLLRHAG